jgi:hypothetical protein
VGGVHVRSYLGLIEPGFFAVQLHFAVHGTSG